MIGLLQWCEGRSSGMERTQLMGLPVLQVKVVRGGWGERRRLSHAARQLKRRGVRRVLVPGGFDRWDVLAQRGLTGVDPMPLYRTVADQLVLAQLKRKGVETSKACVALRGESVDSDLARTAYLLCQQVRGLLIQVEQGGEKLRRELYSSFGAGTPVGVQTDAAVRFGGVGQEEELVLCGQPDLLGLRLAAPELVLPEEVEPMPLLCVLWQAGVLKTEKLRVYFQ